MLLFPFSPFLLPSYSGDVEGNIGSHQTILTDICMQIAPCHNHARDFSVEAHFIYSFSDNVKTRMGVKVRAL